MPDIRVSRVQTRLKDKAVAILGSQSWPADPGPAGAVLVLAAILSALHIEFQYVAGAAVAIYAQRVAYKRFAPINNYRTPDAPVRPVRESLAKMGDPKASEWDFNIAP